MKERITLCGDDCLQCPRYNAESDLELRRVAELWYHVGWRDRVLPPEEMRCTGCSPEKKCTYGLVECTARHGVSRCGLCAEFPCTVIREMLARSEQYREHCRSVCTAKEYAALEKAFFCKEKNLERI